MAKDALDPGTFDAFPKKRGAPVLDPDRGPMTPAERKAKQRAGKTTIEFHLSPKLVTTLDKKRGDLSRDEWLTQILRQSHK